MTTLSKEYKVIKKEDISGEIISEFEDISTVLVRLPREQIVDIIAELTEQLALYQKLLTDTDAVAVSITP